MNYKKVPVKVLSLVSVLLGASVLCLQRTARADDGFLECIGSAVNSGYSVPQPSESEAPAPVASSPTPASPSPVASNPPSTGSSPTQYGVFIKPERHNAGLLSADIYLLTAQGGWIKQVGHADLDTPSNSDAESDTPSYASDASSPFPFQLTISQGQASLIQATLFSGELLSNLPLDCRGGRHGR